MMDLLDEFLAHVNVGAPDDRWEWKGPFWPLVRGLTKQYGKASRKSSGYQGSRIELLTISCSGIFQKRCLYFTIVTIPAAVILGICVSALPRIMPPIEKHAGGAISTTGLCRRIAKTVIRLLRAISLLGMTEGEGA